MKRILATATALFALASSGFAAESARYELRVEYSGNVYTADYGLTGDDCLIALDQFRAKRMLEISSGDFVLIADDSASSCVGE
jgi:hypothetical protein